MVSGPSSWPEITTVASLVAVSKERRVDLRLLKVSHLDSSLTMLMDLMISSNLKTPSIRIDH
jgi:hypothetical protein